MVFNGVRALTVAHVSATVCQRMACIPLSERVSSTQLLDLLCCFPLQQFGRLVLCIWTYLCVPPVDYSYFTDSDDDDDDSDQGIITVDFDDAYSYMSRSD